MKRFGAFILALGLILTLFAACGTAEEQASPTAAQTQASAATESVGTEAPEAAESAAPEAETLYGSFDWETPVSLPLTEETVTLSYWFFTQPFMGSLEVDYDRKLQ